MTLASVAVARYTSSSDWLASLRDAAILDGRLLGLPDHDQLRRHLTDFVSAYNFGRRLKTLKGLKPYEFICKRWTSEPDRFMLNPLHQMPGLNT